VKVKNRQSKYIFDGIFQYGSDFIKEKKCRQDGIAPQARIRGLDEDLKVFIPMTSKYSHIRNFIDAHLIKNYGWIFTELKKDDLGYVIRRKP
jgi:hypothetical protein